MSHYCEKARWGLAHAGVPYVEEAHLQVLHYRAVRPYSDRGMVPVLITESEAIADSTRILEFLDRALPPPRKLYPDAQRAQIEELEEWFDESLGIETRRWVYFQYLGASTREVLKTAAQGTPRWQRTVAPLLLPMMRMYLNRHLKITRANVEQGLASIAETFDAVADRMRDGRRYLLGDRFTAADLTFGCMAAPILMPPEYGIRLPTLEELPVAARADVQRFRAHPAGAFALRLFKDDRL